MNKTGAQKTRLRAESVEDMTVLSALLQDAAIRVEDMAYQKSKRRFALVANRFRWESRKRLSRKAERIRSGFHMDHVLSVKFQHIPKDTPDHVLALLSIEAEPQKNGTLIITFAFSGYATLQLTVECIEAYLQDLGEPWPAKSQPRHS